MVKLTSSDNEEFSVERAVAERSALLKNMLEDVGDSEDVPIPLPNVSANVLKKVLEYCKHHQGDAAGSGEEEKEGNVDLYSRKVKSEDVDEWDAGFIQVDSNEFLFEIILAANYLDIKGLLDLGCKTVATMLKGKTAEQIRDMFNIENDFTPEEEEQIRRENEWAVDA